MSFENLGLSEDLLEAVKDKGYTTPSPIQLEAIPAVLTGRDVMAAAQTGTGKTAGFTLPLLKILAKGSRAKPNQARALILTPTRELAAQVSESVTTYGKKSGLKSTVVFGGVKINPQMTKLRGGVDILVATPGRLLDLYNQKAIKFSSLEVLILDEADRMLDMGFIHDIRKILAVLPKKRQNLMFSATFSEDIRSLAKKIVSNPIEISIAPETTTADTVTQKVYPVDKSSKKDLLIHLIKTNNWEQVLVFTKTKHGANRLTKQLEAKHITAAAIHGNKSQAARTRALANFKTNDIKVLVATDIAARGLDIDNLPHVVNFDLPNVSEDYVHRIGRTGRAGKLGEAVSLVCMDDFKLLQDVEQLIQRHIEREYVDTFEPINDLPKSREIRALKDKKPKKGGGGNSHHFKSEHSDGRRGGNSNNRRGGASSDGAKKRTWSGSKGGKPSAGRRISSSS
jgi:ATP-dependent RNA helicase RhlE